VDDPSHMKHVRLFRQAILPGLELMGLPAGEGEAYDAVVLARDDSYHRILASVVRSTIHTDVGWIYGPVPGTPLYERVNYAAAACRQAIPAPMELFAIRRTASPDNMNVWFDGWRTGATWPYMPQPVWGQRPVLYLAGNLGTAVAELVAHGAVHGLPDIDWGRMAFVPSADGDPPQVERTIESITKSPRLRGGR
jgi:hypothetical protein